MFEVVRMSINGWIVGERVKNWWRDFFLEEDVYRIDRVSE